MTDAILYNWLTAWWNFLVGYDMNHYSHRKIHETMKTKECYLHIKLFSKLQMV